MACLRTFGSSPSLVRSVVIRFGCAESALTRTLNASGSPLRSVMAPRSAMIVCRTTRCLAEASCSVAACRPCT